jgi:hypothetical protein
VTPLLMRAAPLPPTDGDPDPISAGTAGEAALWGGSSAAEGMAANPLGAHQVGNHTPTEWSDDPRRAFDCRGVPAAKRSL